ncbi:MULTISPECIES: RNA methyltransferase [Thalassolituus]|uniref:RNA methyltransferase n=1 Tax=Thalassolituus TaxID=187492 RepID=UPI000C69DC9E|nr:MULTISPECIES: RNA methyltransferase [Thalassolituus]MAX86906.1 tRNA (cytosine(32)/uridine(32)-2'-O)-methyltransferase TrmJ [Oceanospirillaceae bacterium]MEE3190973.1 RNA methyltransferase [Pseudomonadota bacterium]|tara:strand:+ start:393 stop:1163 length:771 start_codon:yes stop_codon:yes gene_type:complete
MLNRICVVMVNTTHSGNIGAAARAMKNMGLSRLLLVDPIASIDEEAIQRSSRAEDILHNAEIHPTLEGAIAGCGLVVGTSARSRSVPWPLMTPRQCGDRAAQAAAAGNDIALVFGRESRGLTNEELHLCNAHVHIPTDENFSSLNVAQAIQVMAYEMRLALTEVENAESEQRWGVDWDYPMATHDQLNGMLQHMEQTLVEIGFLDPNTPKQLMTRVRRLFQRAAPDRMEINILRGMLAAIQRRTDPSESDEKGDKA